MSEKYKKKRKYLNHVENLLFVLIDITRSAVGTKICAITAGIKKYKSIIKKKKKKLDEIKLLGKVKLNTIEDLIYKALFDSCISHDEIVSVNNILREYNETKNIETMVLVVKNILRRKTEMLEKLNKID